MRSTAQIVRNLRSIGIGDCVDARERGNACRRRKCVRSDHRFPPGGYLLGFWSIQHGTAMN
jgi:hypothetical protein